MFQKDCIHKTSFPLGIKNEIKTLRALLRVKDKQTDEQNWTHKTFLFRGAK